MSGSRSDGNNLPNYSLLCDSWSVITTVNVVISV